MVVKEGKKCHRHRSKMKGLLCRQSRGRTNTINTCKAVFAALKEAHVHDREQSNIVPELVGGEDAKELCKFCLAAGAGDAPGDFGAEKAVLCQPGAAAGC
jgi:hypothetical protein